MYRKSFEVQGVESKSRYAVTGFRAGTGSVARLP